MKRSKMVKQLQTSFLKHMHCGPECCADDTKMYSTVLADLEAAGMQLVSDNEAQMWEPEEGWNAWLVEQERKDTARDFEIPEHDESRSASIARAFLAGYSFEALAQDYNVTRERIRQIVCRNRRLYKKED